MFTLINMDHSLFALMQSQMKKMTSSRTPCVFYFDEVGMDKRGYYIRLRRLHQLRAPLGISSEPPKQEDNVVLERLADYFLNTNISFSHISPEANNRFMNIRNDIRLNMYEIIPKEKPSLVEFVREKDIKLKRRDPYKEIKLLDAVPQKMEYHEDQPIEVHNEKCSIYNATISYYKKNIPTKRHSGARINGGSKGNYHQSIRPILSAISQKMNL
ncbi:hypothetical protein C0J52_02394 [Blattella germanica]|nr:hypothetical protein C0J52_02394 [Blattella germanica]